VLTPIGRRPTSALRRWHLRPQSESRPRGRHRRHGLGKIVGSIDTSPYRAPHGIQIGPDGIIYVASDLDHKLLVIDPKARK
jgi:hypothetical protein